MVATTVSDRGSIRDTVPSTLLATQTAPGPTAIPVGPAPTRMVAVVAPVAGSIRVTVPSTVSATHTPAVADGDRARAVTDRDRVGQPPGAVDLRDGVVEVVGHPGRAGALGDARRLVADVDGALDGRPNARATRATAEKPLAAHTEPVPAAIGLGTVLEPPGGSAQVGPLDDLAEGRIDAQARGVGRVERPQRVAPSSSARRRSSPGDRCVARPVRGSIFETESSSRFATQRPPAPAEMSPGLVADRDRVLSPRCERGR